jgi:hypothetical protein
MRISLLLLAVAAGAAFAADGQPAAKSDPRPAVFEKLLVKHLPNALQVHPRVISGGEPEGEAGFAELRGLGIKTVISVDGATPDVKLAKKFGLRYVHLPHGYGGIPEERVKELAKGVRDLPGLIYIHCHHGKHRSPAATAAACVGAGLLESKDARQVLVVAGTSESYRGLFQTAIKAKRFEDQVLDAFQAKFPATAKLPPVAEAMVGVEQAYDHLQLLAANKWKPMIGQPALEPAHEALLLREHFAELLRTRETMHQPRRFQELMIEGEAAAAELETELRNWRAAVHPKHPPSALTRRMDRVATNCTACHQQFRDVPLEARK